jgi:hypothetical protein
MAQYVKPTRPVIFLYQKNEDTTIENLLSLLREGEITKFFELFPQTLQKSIESHEWDSVWRELIFHFFSCDDLTFLDSSSQKFINILIHCIPRPEDRLLFYKEIINIIEQYHPEIKDDFLVRLFYNDNSREITRYIYERAEPYGNAHYVIIFHFITGSIIDIFGSLLQLRRPQIIFRNEKDVFYHIPSQSLPLDISEKKVVCSISIGSEQISEITLEHYLNGDHRETREFEGPLPPARGTYRFSLMVDKEVIKTWEFPGFSDNKPFLAFRESSGILHEGGILPRKRTWFISRFPLIHMEGVLERGQLGSKWASFRYYLVNPLPHCEYYLSIPPDSLFRLPFISPDRRPILVGDQIEGIIFNPPIPWFSNAPRLLIPIMDGPGVDSQEIAIERMSSIEGEDPIKLFRIPCEEEYIARDENSHIYIINLSHGDLLGPGAVGSFRVKFSGSETVLSFCIAPNLRILFHPPLLFLPSKDGPSIEIEIEGPSSVHPLTQCTKIREGLFKYQIDCDSIHQEVSFDLFYKREGGSPCTLQLCLGLPLISWSFKGLPEGIKIINENGRYFILKDLLTDSLRTASVTVEKPGDLPGKWKISVGIQESENYTIEDADHISFPLSPFHDTILEYGKDPLPVILEYTIGEFSTKNEIFSLLDWTIEYTELAVEFKDGNYFISVSGLERGRSRRAFITIRSTDGIEEPSDGDSIFEINPPYHQWQNFSTKFTLPLFTSTREFTLGFILAEGDSLIRFPRKLKIGDNPFPIGEWYFSRREWRLCLDWLDHVRPEDPRYIDALVMRAKCLANLAEEIPENKEKFLKDAINLLETIQSNDYIDNVLPILKAHLYNRLGLCDPKNTMHYQQAKEILVPILARSPLNIPALAEYGISQMGLGMRQTGMRIYMYLQHLDPRENHLETLYGKIVLLMKYFEKNSGAKVDNRDKIIELLEKIRIRDSSNPLYDSLIAKIQGEQGKDHSGISRRR